MVSCKFSLKPIHPLLKVPYWAYPDDPGCRHALRRVHVLAAEGLRPGQLLRAVVRPPERNAAFFFGIFFGWKKREKIRKNQDLTNIWKDSESVF